MSDLLIRGAAVLDGTGAPAAVRDVAVSGGKIVAPDGAARQVVDAGGLALMPGIIDLHTHYDAQVTWDPRLTPSVALGVTTAILGNCGFGIAPCPPQQRETMLKNLSVVEGMDLDALLAGTRWDFESFADYLAALERIRPYANVGVLAGHSCIRIAVMGEEASLRKVPTQDQLSRMRAVLREALRAGAAGFASSFSPNHSGWGGLPMPSTIASDEELKALTGELKSHGKGIFVVDQDDIVDQRHVQIFGDEPRPDSLDRVRTGLAARDHRRKGRLDGVGLDAGVPFLQRPRDAGDPPSGPLRRDDRVDVVGDGDGQRAHDLRGRAARRSPPPPGS